MKRTRKRKPWQLKIPRHREEPQERLIRAQVTWGTIPVSIRLLAKIPKPPGSHKRGRGYYAPLSGTNKLYHFSSPAAVMATQKKITELMNWLAEHGEFPRFS